MEPTTLALLVGISFATAIVSAVIGMCGGIFLLGALASFLPPVVAGTTVDSRILDKVDERTFVFLYKTTLTLVATRMILEQIL